MPSTKEYAAKYYREHKKEFVQYSRNRRERLREEILLLLGNKCAICGFDDSRALQIDHKLGNGAGHRRKKAYLTYYGEILNEIKAGSKDYQILCANHNWIKRVELGEHK